MSEFLKKAHKSKLNNLHDAFDNIEENIINNKNNLQDYPRSYRCTKENMETLKDLIIQLSVLKGRKVNESKLINALIFLSKEMDKKKILKALKEIS